MVSDELPSRNNRSVILLLVTENLRNCQSLNKMGMMVRAYSVDCLQHLCSKVFSQDLQSKTWYTALCFFL